MRLSGELAELASGIDALYLSGRADVPSVVLEGLEDARERAAQISGPVSTQLGGQEFVVAPYGWGKYRFRLAHRNGLVGITSSEHLPAIRLQPKAEFLHGVGASEAVRWFRELLERACGPVRLTASRLDVHADWQGWSLEWGDRERFVCRADALALRGEGGELTGWEFGRRKSKTVCARIYDKTLQVEREGLDYWLDIWGSEYDSERPVLRVEFEFGREGLRQFGLDTDEQAIRSAGALWSWVTDEWLSYRSPTSDQTRSRWPVAPEWRQIQRATIGRGSNGLERTQSAYTQGQLRTLAPGLVGYVASFAALMGTSGISDTCEALQGFLRHYGVWSEVRFADRVANKRHRWLLP